MPTERVEFKGSSVDEVVRKLEQAGATATNYQVRLYTREQPVGMGSGVDYEAALLGAGKEAGIVTEGLDLSKYRTEITVTAEKPSTVRARAAGAGAAEQTTATYTNRF